MNKFFNKYILITSIFSYLVFCSCSEEIRSTSKTEAKPNTLNNTPSVSITLPTHSIKIPDNFTPPTATSSNILRNGILVQIFPVLVDLPNVNNFTIADDWSGDFGYSPVIAHYTFTKQLNQFEVVADFRSGKGQNVVQTTYSFTIPSNIITDFLKALTNIPLNEGKYALKIDSAGDYPSIKIEASIGNEKLYIFTDSPAIDYLPWGLKYDNREFVINSDLPTKAIKNLRPYLQKDVLRTLVGINPGWCGPGFPCP